MPPIEFSAFRQFADNGDQMLYIQGDKLKSTKNQANKSAHVFKAATDEFVAAFKRHYGVHFESSLKQYLSPELTQGKPLTARTIKALIDFADGKMGSAKSIDAGGKAIDLAKLGTDKMSRVGFGRDSKVAKAQMGQATSAAATLAAFKFGEDGKVDLTSMLRHLNTFRAYIDREVSARNLSTVPAQEPMADLAAPNAARPLLPDAAGQAMRPLAPRLSDADAETAKLFEKGLFTAIDAMDNKELSDVYQGLLSKGTDDFKKELTRIINHPDAKPSTARLAEKAFADLCRIESMVVSEISRRMILDQTPDDQKANVPSLMERYVGAGAVSASHYGNAKDMSTVNLGIVARNAAQGSNSSKVASGKVNESLKNYGMGAADARKIGDMLRSQELTVNMKFAALMGYSRTGEKKPSLFKRQNAHLVNTFESKELQGRDPLGSGDLKHRDQVEKAFFPEFGSKSVSGKERPVYGALNTQKYKSGAADTYGGNYGRVVVVMKPHVKQRCTYALDDTFFGIEVAMPAARRAEIEEKLVAAFADRFEDPAAVLAEMRKPGSPTAVKLDSFFNDHGHGHKFSAQVLGRFSSDFSTFFEAYTKEGAKAPDGEEIIAHLIDAWGDKAGARSAVANYDNIENLIAQKADFTALNFGVAQLRQQENPKSPISSGVSYIEAQIHGPVLLAEDVEEIRIDIDEIEEYFENLYDKLSEEEKAGLDEEEWVKSHCDAAKAEILADTRNASFKVTFYRALDTRAADEQLYFTAKNEQEETAVSHMKEHLTAVGNSFLTERRAELLANVSRYIYGTANAPFKAYFGDNVANLPDWVVEEADRLMREMIEKEFGVSVAIQTDDQVPAILGRTFSDFLSRLNTALKEMDAQHIDDPARRERILKEVIRLRAPNSNYVEAVVRLDVAAERALGDINAAVRETFEKDIEGGAELMQWAFAGLPPVSGVAENNMRQRIMNEIRSIQADITGKNFHRDTEYNLDSIAKRIRQNAIKSFVEKKAMIMRQQTFFEFPSVEERNAFLSWAISAGKLKNQKQFEGTYEASSKLVDAFEAKLKSGAPLTAQDVLDCYKAFAKTAMEWMIEDGKEQGASNYGADERQSFFGRIASVALSRLAVRLGNEAVGKIAAALDTPDGRWLYQAVVAAQDADVGDVESAAAFGTLETASAFLETLVGRIPDKFGFPIHVGDPNVTVGYAAVPPFARGFVAQISPKTAEILEQNEPYDASKAGPRFLVGAPPPVNAQALPQNNAQRKQFLLRMLPIYHAHEKAFDKGYNYHGRTHATRSFVLSIAMGNILKEKGVNVDLNAVALGTAGHDTGRMNNGRETAESEKRSADTVNAAVEKLYPGAAGEAWKGQVESNITTRSAEQTTVEGYLFKSADSLDYWRVDELDEKKFMFLQKPILTADGIVVRKDDALRRQLMKEARLLTELTAPSFVPGVEHKRLTIEIGELPNGPEFNLKSARQEELEGQMRESETQQTETLGDQQIIDLVENAIRSRPQDFPLLTKYYLNAD